VPSLQGKGLKYGEPRRKFTTSIRSEFTRSDQAAQDISLLLAQISSLQPFPETGPITAEQKLIAPPSNPFSPSTASGLPRDAASPGGKASDEVSNGAGSAVKAPSRVTSPDPRSPSALSFSTAAQIALKVLPGSNAAADPAIPVMSARQALLAELQEKEPQQACVRLFVLLDKLRNQCLARALYLDVLEPKNLEFFDRQQLVLTPALTSAEVCGVGGGVWGALTRHCGCRRLDPNHPNKALMSLLLIADALLSHQLLWFSWKRGRLTARQRRMKPSRRTKKKRTTKRKAPRRPARARATKGPRTARRPRASGG
jgi:hypothetical protein